MHFTANTLCYSLMYWFLHECLTRKQYISLTFGITGIAELINV